MSQVGADAAVEGVGWGASGLAEPGAEIASLVTERPKSRPEITLRRDRQDEGHRYFIRRYSSTVEVRSNGEDEQELLRLTATVPFDDLRPGLIRT